VGVAFLRARMLVGRPAILVVSENLDCLAFLGWKRRLALEIQRPHCQGADPRPQDLFHCALSALYSLLARPYSLHRTLD
jgi:hypothetical protein